MAIPAKIGGFSVPAVTNKITSSLTSLGDVNGDKKQNFQDIQAKTTELSSKPQDMLSPEDKQQQGMLEMVSKLKDIGSKLGLNFDGDMGGIGNAIKQLLSGGNKDALQVVQNALSGGDKNPFAATSEKPGESGAPIESTSAPQEGGTDTPSGGGEGPQAGGDTPSGADSGGKGEGTGAPKSSDGGGTPEQSGGSKETQSAPSSGSGDKDDKKDLLSGAFEEADKMDGKKDGKATLDNLTKVRDKLAQKAEKGDKDSESKEKLEALDGFLKQYKDAKAPPNTQVSMADVK